MFGALGSIFALPSTHGNGLSGLWQRANMLMCISTEMIGVCVSKNYATGHFNSIPLPSFLLIRLRKVYFMDWLPGRVDGSGY